MNYTPEVRKQLERFASNDMRMARKEDEIIIARTLKGNVTLQYFYGRVYKITQHITGKVLFTGKAKGCKEAIINLYDVRSES